MGWFKRLTESTVVDRTPVSGDPVGNAVKTAAGSWVISGIMAGEGIIPSEETVVARAIITAAPFIVSAAAMKGAEAGARQAPELLEQRLLEA